MPPGSVIGREAELAAAEAVCQGAAAGRGSVLVIVGEPGIGKTALLGAVSAAPGWRLLRATGVEAESAVAFATLQGLLWPLRDELDRLEARQARLIRGVMDLGPAEGATTFALGAATLALFSVSSQDQPLLVVVDDAHWADVASQEVICFVGRRLVSERIAMFAGVRAREYSVIGEERSFAHLTLPGLPADEARSLLETASSDSLAPTVVSELLDVCAGNPLGLIELPLALTRAQRRGEQPLPDLIEVGPAVQRAFAARAATLDPGANQALLVLAASGESDVALLQRTGVTSGAVDAIKASGLVQQQSGTLSFMHPLMQAAIYSAANPDERRAAHRALADVVEGPRRAWHLASAASGPDESVARSLEAVADESRLAGGLAAEAQALERAAELTPARGPRARRMLGAARAWRRAGRLQHGMSIVERALPLAADIRTRAELQLERGSWLVREGEHKAASTLMLAEAERAASHEPKLAAQMLVKAALAAHINADAPGAIATAVRALVLAGDDGGQAELDALNAVVEVRTAAGAPPEKDDIAYTKRAADLLEQPELRAGSEEVHWIAYCLALFEIDGRARRLSDRAIAETRASGDVWNLCYALYARAAIEQVTGRLDAARPYASEGVALAEQIGEPWRHNEALAVLGEVEAARGIPEEFQRVFDLRSGYALRDPSDTFYRSNGLGWAYLACGRFDESISSLETASRYIRAGPARAWYHLVPLELADAYLNAGKKKEAEALLVRWGPEIEASPLVRPKAKLARVRALAASEARYDAAFGDALALLDRMPQPFERARTELAWGERLHRSKRTSEAATHLERALAHFEVLGAVGWADRTSRTLEVVSGKARQAQPRRTDVLSAQELRVAQHAAAGMRDREIAATLYLSPRTVGSYLQSAYRKLDVTNRTQLAAVLAGDGLRPFSQLSEPVHKLQ
jgi:DNA-binding CsgD family transcriptional regulator